MAGRSDVDPLRRPTTRLIALYRQPTPSRRNLLVVAVTFLVVVTTLMILAVGPAGLGATGVMLVAGLAIVLVVFALGTADRAVLALAGARPVSRADQPRYHNLVDGLCISAGLTKPSLHLVDDPALNAFSVAGPRRTSIALTRGAVEQFSRIELEAVLAHELFHVKRGDAFPSTLAVILLGWPGLAVDWGRRGLSRPRNPKAGASRPRGVMVLLAAPLVLLFPVALVFGQLVRLAVGREREMRADQGGVRLTRYPPGLVSALERIRARGGMVVSASRSTAHLWIVPPLQGPRNTGRLVASHPSTEVRIVALKDL
ncbi:MAG: M48 family metalloprotease [Acidimicrobiia bacterium]